MHLKQVKLSRTSLYLMLYSIKVLLTDRKVTVKNIIRRQGDNRHDLLTVMTSYKSLSKEFFPDQNDLKSVESEFLARFSEAILR